jgi:hypothetical protein
MLPRPILKRTPPSYQQQQQHHHHHAVHFPPSPSLTRTFSAHSSATYDRSPIVVSPNNCALPERGCPGRTYLLDDPASVPNLSPPCGRRAYAYANDFHPRALAFASACPSSPLRQPPKDDPERTPTLTYPSLPQLIPDLSSESDESDSFPSNPPPNSAQAYGLHGLAVPTSRYEEHNSYTPVDVYGSSTSPSALSFLPYPPSSPINPSYHYAYSHEEDPKQKPRRRRGERERKHESSRDPDRIRNSTASLCKSMSSFSVSDDGCLGGF